MNDESRQADVHLALEIPMETRARFLATHLRPVMEAQASSGGVSLWYFHGVPNSLGPAPSQAGELRVRDAVSIWTPDGSDSRNLRSSVEQGLSNALSDLRGKWIEARPMTDEYNLKQYEGEEGVRIHNRFDALDSSATLDVLELGQNVSRESFVFQAGLTSIFYFSRLFEISPGQRSQCFREWVTHVSSAMRNPALAVKSYEESARLLLEKNPPIRDLLESLAEGDDRGEEEVLEPYEAGFSELAARLRRHKAAEPGGMSYELAVFVNHMHRNMIRLGIGNKHEGILYMLAAAILDGLP